MFVYSLSNVFSPLVAHFVLMEFGEICFQICLIEVPRNVNSLRILALFTADSVVQKSQSQASISIWCYIHSGYHYGYILSSFYSFLSCLAGVLFSPLSQ